MFFRRLEILGFKSFADKTVFEFPENIISIVGPNGCGKSNVVEAIRWVLGEQNPSNLRTKLMNEVIFGGCEGRKPLGLAEVTLTLDNSRRVLPVDLEEVSVSRRLFRSGESEYLINKTLCRLKDITDLFLDTGIGRHAYSLMEQGKIDFILNSKPEQRRSFFEEAAGIMKYRIRRESTLHKLETTSSNLLRLEDVLGEIKRQMDSLYQQKRRAERFKMLKEEMKTLEIRLRRSEHQRIRSESEENFREFEVLKSELNQKKEKITLFSLELAQARSKAKATQEELNLLNDSLQNLTAKIQEINAKSIRLVERKNHLCSEITRIDRELKEIEIKTVELASKREAEEFAKRRWAERLAMKREKLLAKEKELASLDEERARWLVDINSGKEEVIELLSQTAQIRNRISTLWTEEKNTKLQLDRLYREQDQSLESKERLLAGLTKEEEILSCEEEKLSCLLKEMSHHEAHIFEKEENLLGLENEIDSLKAELQAGQAQFDTLERLEKEFAGYSPGVKAILTAGDRLKGILGVVADLLDAPVEYKAAIEAILGENLQAVIVKRAEDAATAIRYLKEGGKDKVVFFPLEDLKRDLLLPLAPDGLEVIGQLLHLVKYEPELQPVFLYLLGNAYLVNEISQVPPGVLKEEGAYLRLVSLSGDTLDTNGVMSGGGEKSKGFGLLGRKQFLKDLSQRLEDLKIHLAGLEEERAAKDEELKALKEELGRKRELAQRLEVSCSHRRRECERIKEGIEENRIELDNLNQEQELQSKELNRIREEIERSTQVQKEIVLATRQKQNSISKLQEEADRHQILVKEQSLEITQLKVDLAGLEERIDALTESIAKLDELSLSLKREESHLKESLGRVQKERGEIQREISSLEKETDNLAEIRDLKKENLSKVRLDYNQIEEEIAFKEEELFRRNRGVEELSERVYRLELEVSGSKVKMEGIAEHLRKEYGLSPEEIFLPIDEEFEFDESVARLEELRNRLLRLGEVNLMAPREYEELKARYEMINGQRNDLLSAQEDLQKIIEQIDKTSKELFLAAFEEIRLNFQQVYQELFEGGKADLIMTQGDPLTTGIEIVAQPPGKRLQNISLLSGGEKAMTAIALLFAIFMTKPSPFCVLDEIDAALDDANIVRFTRMIERFNQTSQFLIITHNKRTMEVADILYGITMQERGVSRLISVHWKERAEQRIPGAS